MKIDHSITPSGQDVFVIKSRNAGPKFSVFGAIHGDEPCGTKAIEKIIAYIQSGKITITSGQLTLVPICNPEAYDQGKRYIDENMNRIFSAKSTSDSRESAHVKSLLDILKGQDYLLDIHSTSAKTQPFVFDDKNTSQTQVLAGAVYADYIINDWNVLYENGTAGATTLDGAAELGVHSVCLECGQHDDPQAVDVAFYSILNCLKALGICDDIFIPLPSHAIPQKLKMKSVVYKQNDDGAFSKNWKNFDAIKSGDTITMTADNSPISIANDDGYILMPDHKCKAGEEWFYIAQ